MVQAYYDLKYCATENLTSMFFYEIEKRIQVKQSTNFILHSLLFFLSLNIKLFLCKKQVRYLYERLF